MRSKDFESSHDASLVPNASTSATSKLSQHEFAERCGDAPWIGPFVVMFSQWAGEGSIPHDDDIDAYSQMVNWCRQRVYGLSTYYEQQQAKLNGKTNGQIEQKEVIAVMPDGRKIKPNADRTGWVYVDTGQPVPQKANGSSTP